MSIHPASKEKLVVQGQLSTQEGLIIAAEVFSSVLFLFNIETNSLQYSREQLAAQLGYDPVNLPADFDLSGIMHPRDWTVFQSHLKHLNGGAYSIPDFLCRFRHREGEYHRFSVRAVRKPGINGMVLVARADKSIISEFDINEIKDMKAETESILEFGMFKYDFVRGKARWSDGMYEMFGYKNVRPEVNFETFIAHLDPGQHALLQQRAAGGRSRITEYTEAYDILTTGGAGKKVQVIGRRWCSAEGRLLMDVGIIRDITEKSNQELSLKRAIDELKRSNKELEEFAYVASHDLQEPLRKISTFSSRLAERYAAELGSEGKLYIERVQVSASNMRTLIDNLLDFSRITRIRQPFGMLNLNFLLLQVKNELEISIEETGTVLMADPLPSVEASMSQIKQLFNNILNNAIKFRRSGVAPEIRISSHRLSLQEKNSYDLPQNKVYHCIRFTDNGIGFEKEYATRIFQIFQRLHGKSEYPGSGIGLAICKKITDNHKGLIMAEDLQGNCACFTVILPEQQT